MQHKWKTSLTLALLLLASLLLFQCSTSTQPPEKPNILMILVDDMGWSDIGCYGGDVNTPNLNRLAEGGIRFTQFHNTAKCFSSRACLLTGLYAQECGMNENAAVFRNAVTLGEVLRTAGYRTLMTGKHHGKDNPYDRGFDRYWGLRDGSCNYFNPGVQREGEGVPAHKTRFFPRTWCNDGELLQPYTPVEKDFYTTDYFTRHALGYLEEYINEDKPFFLYLAYTAPHDPLMAWPEDIQKYQGKFMAGYESIRTARYQRQLDMGLLDETYPLSEPTYDDWEALPDEEKYLEDQRMAIYCAMIDRVDQNIGKVLDAIEKMGELDNTLVLFASDNGCAASQLGGMNQYNETAQEGEPGSMTRWTKIGPSWSNVSNSPFRLYKMKTHKGGSCTPLIAYWPKGIKEVNRICHEPGHFIDIMPTLLEISGAEYPTEFKGEEIIPLKGQSLVPVFQGQDPEERGPIYWQHAAGKGIRLGDWRLVSDDNGPWNLYDMRVDKTETNNLINKYPDVAQNLEAKYLEWVSKFE